MAPFTHSRTSVVLVLCTAASASCFAQWQDRIKNVRLPDDWAPLDVGRRTHSDYFMVCADGPINKDTSEGFRCYAYRDAPRGPLPEAYTHGYALRTPWLHEDDLFPLLGHLYCKDSIDIPRDGIPPSDDATRVPPEKVPPGIQLRYDTYVFPLSNPTDNGERWSGSLHGHFLYFWAISATKDAKAGLQGKLGILADDEKWPQDRVKEIVWHWYREGDWVEIGEYRHKLLKIVPPREPKELQRGTARMVGWIELDRHAEPLPAAKPKS